MVSRSDELLLFFPVTSKQINDAIEMIVKSSFFDLYVNFSMVTSLSLIIISNMLSLSLSLSSEDPQKTVFSLVTKFDIGFLLSSLSIL